MQLKKHFSLIIIGLLVVVCDFACFVTSHSYNHGKLLNPGEGLVTYGYGNTYGYDMEDERYAPYEREYTADFVPVTLKTHSFDYRLGFLSKYPFGKGTELGLHAEFSLFRNGDQRIKTVYPPNLELSLRCGFAELQVLGALYHHNIDLGWVVGYWVDNSWFGGYVAGLEYRYAIPYVGVWSVLNGTDAWDSAVSEDYFTEHDRSWHLKYCVGVSAKVKRLPFLPDYITPEITIIQPLSNQDKRTGFAWQIGLRWLNGI